MDRDAVEQRMLAHHEAALRVVREFDDEGRPFVLYLRKFDIDVLHGPADGQRKFSEYRLVGGLPEAVNVISVQAKQDAVSRHLLDDSTHPIPSFLLEETEWKGVVDWLIVAADIIVSECLMLSEGVRYELEQCYRFDKFDQTILILPPPNSPFATIDHEPIIQKFVRCVWANELHTRDLLDTFVAADLVARIGSIAQLDRDARLSLKDPTAKRGRFPVTYDGVVHGYVEAAFDLELQNDAMGVPETAEAWHYKFWSYFRAVSILGLRLARGSLDRDGALQLIDCYLKLGYLMLRTEREGDTIVLLGDLEFAAQCASSANWLARRIGDTAMLPLVESLSVRIQELEEEIRSNRGKVEKRPRATGLAVRGRGASAVILADE